MSSGDEEEGGRPYWVPDEEANCCADCESGFTIINRRHHCRFCGQIFCDQCSSTRITNICGVADRLLHRICNYCGNCLLEEELAIIIPTQVGLPYSLLCTSRPNRVMACLDSEQLGPLLLQASRSNDQFGLESITSSDTNSSLLRSCPACSRNLEKLDKEKARTHVAHCLNKRRDVIVGTRFSVTELEEDMPGKECGICFEQFTQGQKIAVLNCLCKYHKKCITEWFHKKPSCPAHYE